MRTALPNPAELAASVADAGADSVIDRDRAAGEAVAASVPRGEVEPERPASAPTCVPLPAERVRLLEWLPAEAPKR